MDGGESDASKLQTLYTLRKAQKTGDSPSLADAIAKLEARVHQDATGSSSCVSSTSRSSRVVPGATRRRSRNNFAVPSSSGGASTNSDIGRPKKSVRICSFANIGVDGLGITLCDHEPSNLTTPSAASPKGASRTRSLDRSSATDAACDARLETAVAGSGGRRSATPSKDPAPGHLLDIRSLTTPPPKKTKHIYIEAIQDGSLVDRDGFICVGDRVMEINSQQLSGLSVPAATNILTQAQCSGQVILAVGIVATVAQLKARERAQRCKSEYSGTVVSSAGSSSGRRQKGHRGGSEPSYLSDGDDPIFRNFEQGSLPGAVDSPPSLISTTSPDGSSRRRKFNSVGKTNSFDSSAGMSDIFKGVVPPKRTTSVAQCRKVVLEKDPVFGYGVEIEGGFGSVQGDIDIFIRKIEVDCQAARSGSLMEGDHILQINEWSTEGMRHDDAVRLLRTSNGDLELVVRSTDVTWAGDMIPKRVSKRSLRSKLSSAGSQSDGGEDMTSSNRQCRRSVSLHRHHQCGVSDGNFSGSEAEGNNMEQYIRAKTHLPATVSADNSPGVPIRKWDRSKNMSLGRPRSFESRIHPTNDPTNQEVKRRSRGGAKMSLGSRVSKLLTRSSDSLNDQLRDSQPEPPALLNRRPEVVQAWARGTSTESSSSPSLMSKQLYTPEEVVVLRWQRSRLGLTLVGGWQDDGTCLPLYIKSIRKGSMAYQDGRLKAGDELLAANGQLLSGLTLREARAFFKRSTGFIVLEVRHRPPLTDYQQFSVSFTCDKELGFVPGLFRDRTSDHCHVFILKVTPGSEASRHVRVGDHLLSINRHSLLFERDCKVRQILSNLPPTLSLVLERRVRVDASSCESDLSTFSTSYRRSLELSTNEDLHSSEVSLSSGTSGASSGSFVSSSGEFEPSPLSSSSLASSDFEISRPSSDSDGEYRDDDEDIISTSDILAMESNDIEGAEEVSENPRLDLAVAGEESHSDILQRQRLPSIDIYRRNSMLILKRMSSFLSTMESGTSDAADDSLDNGGYAVPSVNAKVRVSTEDGDDRFQSGTGSIMSNVSMQSKQSHCSETTLRGSDYDNISRTSSVTYSEHEECAYDVSHVAPRSFHPSSNTLQRMLRPGLVEAEEYEPAQMETVNMKIRMVVPPGVDCGISVSCERKPDRSGVICCVDCLFERSPASLAGVKCGDIIKKVNGSAVQRDSDVIKCCGDVTLLISRHQEVGEQTDGPRSQSLGAKGLRRFHRGGSGRRALFGSDRKKPSPRIQPHSQTSSGISTASNDLSRSDASTSEDNTRWPSLPVDVGDEVDGGVPIAKRTLPTPPTDYTTLTTPGEPSYSNIDQTATTRPDDQPSYYNIDQTATTRPDDQPSYSNIDPSNPETPISALTRRVAKSQKKRRVSSGARRFQASDISNSVPLEKACLEHRPSLDSIESRDSACVVCMQNSNTATTTRNVSPIGERCERRHEPENIPVPGNGHPLPSVPLRTLSLSQQHTRHQSFSSVDSVRSPDSGFSSHDSPPVAERRTSSLGRKTELSNVSSGRPAHKSRVLRNANFEAAKIALGATAVPDETDFCAPYASSCAALYSYNRKQQARNEDGAASTATTADSSSAPPVPDSPLRGGSATVPGRTANDTGLSTKGPAVVYRNSSLPSHLQRPVRSGVQTVQFDNKKMVTSHSIDSGVFSSVSSASLPTFDEYAANPNTFPSTLSTSMARPADTLRTGTTSGCAVSGQAAGGSRPTSGQPSGELQRLASTTQLPPVPQRDFVRSSQQPRQPPPLPRQSHAPANEPVYMNTQSPANQQPSSQQQSRGNAPIYHNLAHMRNAGGVSRQSSNASDTPLPNRNSGSSGDYSDYEVMQSPRNSSLFNSPPTSPSSTFASPTNSVSSLPIMQISDGEQYPQLHHHNQQPRHHASGGGGSRHGSRRGSTTTVADVMRQMTS